MLLDQYSNTLHHHYIILHGWWRRGREGSRSEGVCSGRLCVRGEKCDVTINVSMYMYVCEFVCLFVVCTHNYCWLYIV